MPRNLQDAEFCDLSHRNWGFAASKMNFLVPLVSYLPTSREHDILTVGGQGVMEPPRKDGRFQLIGTSEHDRFLNQQLMA